MRSSFRVLSAIVLAASLAAGPALAGSRIKDTALLGAVRRLTLGRLDADEARALATTLLSRAGGDVEAARVADEAAGHPLFIDELVRHAVEGRASAAPVHLDEALWARVSGLEAPARELLEILATAGGPVSQEILAEALEARFDDLDRRLGLLRVANLARTTGSRRTDLAEPYHDRVREAVFARQPAEHRRRLHARLAIAIEGTGRGDPELLFEQWLGAGETQRALTHGEAAARRAAEALAFDRAARLYRRLLGLATEPGPRRALEEALASALTNAGRGAEAAASFLSACEGATAAEALELRRRAAEQLLRSGHIDEGLAAIRSVLEAVAMALPSTPRRALASLLLRRARLRLRGLSYSPRDTSQVTASELTRIDVCWSVAAGLAVADPLCASDFQTRNLLLALDAGEPYRIARALAMEIPFLATAGSRSAARVARLVELASERAAGTGHPHAIGLATGMAGLAAYLQGRFRTGLVACEQAEQILRDRCVGVSWELDTVQLFSLECLAYLGELAEMDRRLTLRLREAHDRGDLYALTHLRAGYLNCVWLMRDDPTTARAEAAAAIAAWSQQSFHTQHFYHFFAQQQIDLYLGDGEAAWRRVLETWPQAKRTMLFRIQLVRIMAQQLRGRSSLLAATSARGADRKRLLGEAARAAEGIAREGTTWAAPWARLLQAGIAACRGRQDDARAHLELAATSFDAADMALYGQIARWRLGRLLQGSQGDALTTTASAAMRAQGITNPSRMAAMHAPGFE